MEGLRHRVLVVVSKSHLWALLPATKAFKIKPGKLGRKIWLRSSRGERYAPDRKVSVAQQSGKKLTAVPRPTTKSYTNSHVPRRESRGISSSSTRCEGCRGPRRNQSRAGILGSVFDRGDRRIESAGNELRQSSVQRSDDSAVPTSPGCNRVVGSKDVRARYGGPKAPGIPTT